MHFYRDDCTPCAERIVTTTATTPPRIERPERADADRTHVVFTDLRRLHLTLSAAHRDALLARGLSNLAIEMHGYVSAPTAIFAANVARALARDHDLSHVPGFFMRGGAWQLNFGEWNFGIVIPVFDTKRRIRALTIRRDDVTGSGKYTWLTSKDKPRGASPGTPPNFSRPELVPASGDLLITEGALKSQIISELEGVATCGIAGVTNFKETFGADLRHALPELKRAVIAFDADFRTNENVRRGLERLTTNLRRAGLNVTIRVWSAAIGKGYDDALIALKGAA